MHDITVRFVAHPPQHLYLDDSRPGMATACFRRTFTLPDVPTAAAMALYAESRFHLYVNGVYIGRGPTFHHPNRLPVTVYDITAHLKSGRNVIAAIVRWSDQAFHNHVPTGKPGLSARLIATLPSGQSFTLETDDQWRATSHTGWRADAPRRSWAIDHIEIFDTAIAPQHWQQPDFDDSAWLTPDITDTALPAGPACFIPADLPGLSQQFLPVIKQLGFHQTASPPIHIDNTFVHRTYAERLLQADRAAPTQIQQHGKLNSLGGGWRIDHLSPDHGAIVEFDLGAQSVGQVILECDCPSAGVIDIAWAEYIRDGRPCPLQKGTSYADQIHVAGPGPVRWQPIQFTGARYIVLYFRGFRGFRGFTGSLTVNKLGFLATEPDLDYRGRFHCDDDQLNDIFTMCRRTIRVGTQEALMDCPTREQATYVGDGHPVARWLAMLTGDSRHWTHLTREQAARPDAPGLIRSTPFSGRAHTLLDYNLLAIIWTRDYLRYTHDHQTPAQTLDTLRNIAAYFDQRTDSRGFFNWHWTGAPGSNIWEHRFDPAADGPEPCAFSLFIDHPGMGWHNLGEPGINRRGFNTALNALRVRAASALADLESDAGHNDRAEQLRARADQLARTIYKTFYRPARGLFDDGELDGQPLNNFSQQTNAWVLQALADIIPLDQQKQIALRMIDEADQTIARGGPYFWLYIYDVLTRLGLHAQAWRLTRQLWTPMLTGGATTLWETFAGDDLDSACHPWSAPPLEFMLTGLLGLPGELSSAPDHRYLLQPRCDLLKNADGRVCLPCGDFTIAWQTDASGQVNFTGNLPLAVTAQLRLPDGQTSHDLSGQWRWSCQPAPACM